MSDLDESKTSDEIIKELFSSLNVPTSPSVANGKIVNQVIVVEKSVDNSSDDTDGEPDSDDDVLSTESDIEEIDTGEVQPELKDEDVKLDEKEEEENSSEKKSRRSSKDEKSKSHKKKKKKRKKKHHSKKDEDGKHKHKKKKKDKKDSKDSHKGESKNEDDNFDRKSNSSEKSVSSDKNSISNGKVRNNTSKDDKHDHKSNEKKGKLNSRSPSYDKVEKDYRKKSSLRKSYSRSRSRSHSRIKSSYRYSRSKSRSKSRHGRYSRSLSKSRHSRYSRSPSSSGRRHRKSRSRSPYRSHKRRRSYSYSKSPSPKRKLKNENSSNSRSKNTLNMDVNNISVIQLDANSSSSSSSSPSSVKQLPIIVNQDDINSIPTPSDVSKPPSTTKTINILALDSIPLPVPPPQTNSSSPVLPDPSCIPLPGPAGDSVSSEEPEMSPDDQSKTELLVVPLSSSIEGAQPDGANKSQDKNKADDGGDKGKSKMIIIKSLKDSIVFKEAQEEAERKAREMATLQPEEITLNEDDSVVSTVTIDLLPDDIIQSIIDENIKKNKEAVQDGSLNVSSEDENIELGCNVGNNVDKDEAVIPPPPDVEEDKVPDVNDIEEGEVSSNEEVKIVTSTKGTSKKSKDDVRSSKHKETKDKEREVKDKDKKKSSKEDKKRKHRGRSRSGSKSRSKRGRSKSRSRSNSRSRGKHKSRKSDRSHTRDSKKHMARSRSRSHGRKSSRSRKSRSKSRTRRRSRSPLSTLRDKVTRKRLLEIARRNAVYLVQNGCLPPSVEKDQLVKMKTDGKSVDELTSFCKQLVAEGNYTDGELSDPEFSSEENPVTDTPFMPTARHPFAVKDKPILMNIRNAPMIPTKTNAERLADQSKLREQFPVSSGSQHRTKESGWVPVDSKDKDKKETVSNTTVSTTPTPTDDTTVSSQTPPPLPPNKDDKVFPEKQDVLADVDISSIVSSRLSAMRKLQDNPNDVEAIKTLRSSQKEVQDWAMSKQEPGQFTGTTLVKVLSQEELASGQQAWARKEQFKEATPVTSHFGLKMMQRMGWTPGEGLGKNSEGTLEPLLLDIKMDKKGFHAQEELTPHKPPIPLAKDLSGKHPVSALVELCCKKKWLPPIFQMVIDAGPDHKKNFVMNVVINNNIYKPSLAAPTKKLAKANAAAACLQALGLIPKEC